MEIASLEAATAFKGKQLPWSETLIIPIGDIQIQENRKLVDLEGLKSVIDYGVKHNAFFIGMGDFVDMESPSSRSALKFSGVYDSVVDAIDAKAQELEDELKKILEPTIGKWLGLVQGHHYHEYQDGTTSDTRFANYLKTKFLGDVGIVHLPFKPKNSHHQIPTIDIFVTHGSGGGAAPTSALNKLVNFSKGFIADIYLTGHHHKLSALSLARIKAVFPKGVYGVEGWLEEEPYYLASTGSFLKGYLQGSQKDGRAQGAYPEKANMNPLALGAIKIRLRPVVSKGSTKVHISVEV